MPLGPFINLAEWGALPWASRVQVRYADGTFSRLVGRPLWQPDGWALPVLAPADGDDWRREAESVRRAFGLNPLGEFEQG